MESISAIHFLIWSILLYPFPFAFVSLCDLPVYDSVSICPHISPCPYVSASIPDPFVQPSSFRLAYISPICHVCLLSSYIDFNSTLLSLSPSVCDLSLLPYSPSGFLKLFDSRNSVIRPRALPETFPHSSLDTTTSLRPIGSAYTYLYSKYLDRDRRPAQRMS